MLFKNIKGKLDNATCESSLLKGNVTEVKRSKLASEDHRVTEEVKEVRTKEQSK